MTNDQTGTPSEVSLSGYTMDVSFIEAWHQRQDQAAAHLAKLAPDDPHHAEMRLNSDRVLVAAIAEGLARRSKVLTRADLENACRKLGNVWPWCVAG